jgi:hypothetical protein
MTNPEQTPTAKDLLKSYMNGIFHLSKPNETVTEIELNTIISLCRPIINNEPCQCVEESTGWIAVTDRLPEFDVDVLIYWRLEKDKKVGGYYDMIEKASITSKTIGKDYINTEWKDSEYNNKTPTHRQRFLPVPFALFISETFIFVFHY